MATLDEILTEWDRDSVVDETKIGHEAARNPMIHSKYIRMLSVSKLQLRKSESDYLKARKIHSRYFRGELNREELDELGWSQYQGRHPTIAAMDELLNTAPELIKLTDRISYHTVCKESLESILKEINSRTWNLKTSLEYQKLINGVN